MNRGAVMQASRATEACKTRKQRGIRIALPVPLRNRLAERRVEVGVREVARLRETVLSAPGPLLAVVKVHAEALPLNLGGELTDRAARVVCPIREHLRAARASSPSFG